MTKIYNIWFTNSVIIKFNEGKWYEIKYHNFKTYWGLTIGKFMFFSSVIELEKILDKIIEDRKKPTDA